MLSYVHKHTSTRLKLNIHLHIVWFKIGKTTSCTWSFWQRTKLHSPTLPNKLSNGASESCSHSLFQKQNNSKLVANAILFTQCSFFCLVWGGLYIQNKLFSVGPEMQWPSEARHDMQHNWQMFWTSSILWPKLVLTFITDSNVFYVNSIFIYIYPKPNFQVYSPL